tara:strand:+ start:4072 stop:5058 length:987 start_codon:yes stop_codon:yes gene_type:complete
MQKNNDLKLVEKLCDSRDTIYNELEKRIIGQKEIIEHIIIALLCKSHALLVGVPGLAKTLMIKSISQIFDLQFNRIQFTPDLMPSDITGTEILEEDQSSSTREFKFIKGPIFANIILADEINRTPPKTQAALLEAMQEHRVTAAGVTYLLDEPFLVLATQNPIEQEGTYPLPEAQLDRFMFSLNIDYPSLEEEIDIVKSTTSGLEELLKPVIKKKDLLSFQNLIQRVPIAENVVEFAVKIVSKTRPSSTSPKFINEWLEWGAGPRASQFLVLGSKAKAILDGRSTPDLSDIISICKPILRHRIITSFNAEADGVNTDQVLEKLIDECS